MMGSGDRVIALQIDEVQEGIFLKNDCEPRKESTRDGDAEDTGTIFNIHFGGREARISVPVGVHFMEGKRLFLCDRKRVSISVSKVSGVDKHLLLKLPPFA